LGGGRIIDHELERRRPVDGDVARHLALERRVPERRIRVRHRVDDRMPTESPEILDELERPLHAPSALRRPAVREHKDRAAIGRRSGLAHPPAAAAPPGDVRDDDFCASSSNAPMSHARPCGRLTPRWSATAHAPPSPVGRAGLPASIAGLPARSARVLVEPPLSASGPSFGSWPTRSPAASPARLQPPTLWTRLWPRVATVAAQSAALPPDAVLPATIVFASAIDRGWSLAIPRSSRRSGRRSRGRGSRDRRPRRPRCCR